LAISKGAVRFHGISFGLYNLEVQAAGFNTWRETPLANLTSPEVKLSVGLFVAPTHRVKSDQRSQVLVTLPKGNAGDLWVRLVPRYSSDFLEDAVTPGGTFSFWPICIPGRFVSSLVFDKET